ncbi:MAG: hypothetical protein MUO82_10475, partial [Candidatus Thermoplasmatota archaeon]|nr:hypothetical protein [Candidatus Thermoplasmatota archaeon]
MREKIKNMRDIKYIILMLLIVTISLIISNASASISPNFVTKTLHPGDCYTVTKIVTIPNYTPKA